MSSWFEFGGWLAGYLVRLRHPETKLAIQHTAKLLGAKVRIRGEYALIFTAPYGLLLYIGGPDLQAYCCICDRKDLDLQAAKRLPFHQYGEPLQQNSWIWFPRISEGGATNYRTEKSGRRNAWIINRVRPAIDTRFEAKSRRDAIVSMGSRIASDFQTYQQELAKISPQDPMSV
jgi:hypothetical protein